jgi:hypothetical protein
MTAKKGGQSPFGSKKWTEIFFGQRVNGLTRFIYSATNTILSQWGRGFYRILDRRNQGDFPDFRPSVERPKAREGANQA